MALKCCQVSAMPTSRRLSDHDLGGDASAAAGSMQQPHNQSSTTGLSRRLNHQCPHHRRLASGEPTDESFDCSGSKCTRSHITSASLRNSLRSCNKSSRVGVWIPTCFDRIFDRTRLGSETLFVENASNQERHNESIPSRRP